MPARDSTPTNAPYRRTYAGGLLVSLIVAVLSGLTIGGAMWLGHQDAYGHSSDLEQAATLVTAFADSGYAQVDPTATGLTAPADNDQFDTYVRWTTHGNTPDWYVHVTYTNSHVDGSCVQYNATGRNGVALAHRRGDGATSDGPC